MFRKIKQIKPPAEEGNYVNYGRKWFYLVENSQPNILFRSVFCVCLQTSVRFDHYVIAFDSSHSEKSKLLQVNARR